MTERQGHSGPIQQFTEVCLACGENIYATASCPTRQVPREVERERLERRVTELESEVARLSRASRVETPPGHVVCPMCMGTWHCSCF